MKLLFKTVTTMFGVLAVLFILARLSLGTPYELVLRTLIGDVRIYDNQRKQTLVYLEGKQLKDTEAYWHFGGIDAQIALVFRDIHFPARHSILYVHPYDGWVGHAINPVTYDTKRVFNRWFIVRDRALPFARLGDPVKSPFEWVKPRYEQGAYIEFEVSSACETNKCLMGGLYIPQGKWRIEYEGY